MSLYEILQVDPTSSTEEIKSSYYRLAKQLHPDKNRLKQSSSSSFNQVLEAYKILSDPEKRRDYDMLNKESSAGKKDDWVYEWLEKQVAKTEQEWIERRKQYVREGLHCKQQQQQQDIHFQLALCLPELFTGVSRNLLVSRKVWCGKCFLQDVSRCPECGGNGNSFFRKQLYCSGCRGTGLIREKNCVECDDRGETTRKETVTVQIPAGSAYGSVLIVAEKGNDRWPDAAEKGNLILELESKEKDASYTTINEDGIEWKWKCQNQHDLLLQIPISLTESLLGTKMMVKRLDGTSFPLITRENYILDSQTLYSVPNEGMTKDATLFISFVVQMPQQLVFGDDGDVEEKKKLLSKWLGGCFYSIKN